MRSGFGLLRAAGRENRHLRHKCKALTVSPRFVVSYAASCVFVHIFAQIGQFKQKGE